MKYKQKPVKEWIGASIILIGTATSCFGGYKLGKSAEFFRAYGADRISKIFEGQTEPEIKNEGQYLARNACITAGGLAAIVLGIVIASSRPLSFKRKEDPKNLKSFYEGTKRRVYKIY